MVKGYFIKKYHILKRIQGFIKILTLLSGRFWRNERVRVGFYWFNRQTSPVLPFPGSGRLF
jgi:hypothetical protein